MSNQKKDELLASLLLVAYIFAFFLSGYISWNWIDPDTFLGFVLFMAAWGLITVVLKFVFEIVLITILSIFD